MTVSGHQVVHAPTVARHSGGKKSFLWRIKSSMITDNYALSITEADKETSEFKKRLVKQT